jgi:hypothetical protein
MFKNEDEFFLEIQDSDQIFSSWANLLGEANEEDVEEQANTSSHRPEVKEACNLQ